MTEVAQPGKPRQIQAFELRMNIIADATIDLLFTKNRVNLALALVCFLLSLFFFLSFLPTAVIFLPLPAAPLVFVFMLQRVLAIDIGSCFMLFQIFILEQCRDFHKAKYVKCILNININAC